MECRNEGSSARYLGCWMRSEFSLELACRVENLVRHRKHKVRVKAAKKVVRCQYFERNRLTWNRLRMGILPETTEFVNMADDK